MRLTVLLHAGRKSPFNYYTRYIERMRDERYTRIIYDPARGRQVKNTQKFVYGEDRPYTETFHQDNLQKKNKRRVYIEPLERWNMFKGDRLRSSSRQPRRAYSTMASQVKEGVLLGLGNPLLDITVVADEAFLQKYNLQANNAIMADDTYGPMFQEMVTRFEPQYGAGGATQNSIRVAQWLLQRRHATSYFGGVGEDENAEILRQCAQAAGVNVRYCTDGKLPTGVCASLITGENRSLVAHLGAADFFTHMFLEEPENWKLVEKAEIIYIGGFVFPVCNQGIFDLAHHACEKNKILCMNLSAPFLCKYFAQSANEHWDIMPYIDILFGNEAEAAEFCKLRGIKAGSIEEMAVGVCNLPKRNKNRERMVVFTQGKDPTIIAKDGKVTVFPINPIEKDLIRDTNGCGDAFVGGFLSQLVHGKPVEELVRCGNYAAKEVIQHWGCSFPEKPNFK